MIRCRPGLLLALFGFVAAARGAEPATVEPPKQVEVIATEPALATTKAATSITLNGQAFCEVERQTANGAKTFTYLPTGATIQDWSEMVTHQVIRLQQRSGSDEVVQFIREKSKSTLRLESILETRKASVFVSLAPGTEGGETQMAVGFAFLDLADPLDIHFVQFVLKPNRMSQAEVEQKLKSWRDLFKTRATALASS